MKIRIRQNLVAGIVFMIFSSIIWFMIPNHIAVVEEGFNAQFFPKIVVIAMFILSTILTISSFFKKDKEIMEIEINEELKVLIYALVMIGYIYLINKIGFIIASLIFTLTSIFLLKGKKVYFLIMTILILIVYFSFKLVLNIQLPSSLI
ncbi:MAG: tripartite tricarboxylate transporter TctB family protein [Pleomorphochaeta sp.]